MVSNRSPSAALERWPVSGQQRSYPVGQPIGILTQVGVVAVQKLQLRTVGTCLPQPDQSLGMSAGDVRQYEGILGIGLGLTRIEVAGASHRQAGHVSNPNRGIPAQLQQQSGGPTRLIHDDRCLMRASPQHQQPQRTFVIGYRLRIDRVSVAVDCNGVVGALADIDAQKDRRSVFVGHQQPPVH